LSSDEKKILLVNLSQSSTKLLKLELSGLIFYKKLRLNTRHDWMDRDVLKAIRKIDVLQNIT